MHQLGFLAIDDGDFEAAHRLFGDGLRLAEELGDKQVLGLLNNGFGELYRLTGDHDRATQYYFRALEYNREAGDRVRQTTSLINLGATELLKGDRESAGEFYRGGLEISTEMADMNGTLYCIEGLAGSYWADRDPELAAIIFGGAAAAREANSLPIELADRPVYERSLDLVRSRIGDEAFDKSYSMGRSRELRSVVESALERS